MEEVKICTNCFKAKVYKLINVKSIITILVTLMFVFLSVTKYFDPKDVLLLITMVFTYYFGHQNGKIEEKANGGN